LVALVLYLFLPEGEVLEGLEIGEVEDIDDTDGRPEVVRQQLLAVELPKHIPEVSFEILVGLFEGGLKASGGNLNPYGFDRNRIEFVLA
jgi:hypothetical protein